MATIRTYLVVDSLPIVISDSTGSVSYSPGATFEANENNASVQFQLDRQGIVAVSSAPGQSGTSVIQGSPGATGPIGPTGPTGVGEANTASSAGGTQSLILAKSGVNLPFKGLTAGTNVTLTPSASDITIAVSGVGEANTSSSSGGTESLVLAKSGIDLPFKGLTAGTGVTLTPSATDVTIAATGEVNTASSAGGTQSLVLAKSVADLPFKGLTAGANITLTPSATDVTIAATAADPADQNNVLAIQVFS